MTTSKSDGSLSISDHEFAWVYFPRTLLEYLFTYFDYNTLLAARRVSRDWNEVIMESILPSKTILHILPDPNSEYWQKMFKKKCKFLPDLTGLWPNIHVHHLKPSLPLWNSSYIDFTAVTTLTLYESEFTLKELVCKMFANMESLRHFQVCQTFFVAAHSHFGLDVNSQFKKFYTRRKAWRKGLSTIEGLESFRIGVHNWSSLITYLKLLSSAKIGNLKKIAIDLSKLYGLPFPGPRIEETHSFIADLVTLNAASLVDLRVKWCHRVETDQDLSRYEEEQDYFLYFLDTLGSAKWPSSDVLQLKILELGFPHVNFQSPLIDLVLIPYLKRQSALEYFFLARVQLSPHFQRFNSRILRNFKMKREYGIQVKDLDPTVSTFQYNAGFTNVEIRLYWSVVFHLGMEPMVVRSWNFKRAPHVKSLKLYNSRVNTFFLSFNAPEIIVTFPHLRQLELLDECDPDDVRDVIGGFKRSQLGDNDFFLIVCGLPLLISLKLSSLRKVTDGGLTGLKPELISKMLKLGNYHAKDLEKPDVPPLSRLKHLKYLELRNLSTHVTDVSVFFGFQFIPKLEKIAFHGQHQITSWGTKVLQKKFKNNPRFMIYLKETFRTAYYNDFP